MNGPLGTRRRIMPAGRFGEAEKADSFRKEEKNLLIITSLEPGLSLLE